MNIYRYSEKMNSSRVAYYWITRMLASSPFAIGSDASLSYSPCALSNHRMQKKASTIPSLASSSREVKSKANNAAFSKVNRCILSAVTRVWGGAVARRVGERAVPGCLASLLALFRLLQSQPPPVCTYERKKNNKRPHATQHSQQTHSWRCLCHNTNGVSRCKQRKK
jgi:hypothetical protein